MSFTIVIMNGEDGKIHAITDKRLGTGSYLDGKIVNWKHVDDDSVKINKIAENVYFTGGALCEISDSFLNILQVANKLAPSKIIDIAKHIPRAMNTPYSRNTHDAAIIFGIYDDGRPFLWKGEHDGTFNITFPKDLHHKIIEISGGLYETTLDRATSFLAAKIRGKKNVDFIAAMEATMTFAASIDPSISQTFDFVTVSSNERTSIEKYYKESAIKFHTSDTGKRIEMTGDQNNLIFYDDNDNEVLRIDDDLVITSVHITPRPYPEPPIFTYTYGPGIRVGIAGGRRTETGPNGFRMYDDNGDLTSGFFPGEVRLDAYTSLHVRDGGLQWAEGYSGGISYKDHANINRTAYFVKGILTNPNLV